MKLALGTVQFGLNYGVANTSGKITEQECRKILKIAYDSGVDTLDTAVAYGNSEEVLGKLGIRDFNIISKIPPFPTDRREIYHWIRNTFNQTLKNLNTECLKGILLHRPLELLEQNGEQAYASLLALKSENKVEKIGVSISQPSDLDRLWGKFPIDIVQAPMNLLDQRLCHSGWLRRLADADVEVHIRSVFLQGLLLMPAAKRPAYFNSWRNVLDRYDNWLKEQKASPLESCLSFLKSFDHISKVIVGVTSAHEMKQIISAMQVEKKNIAVDFSCDDVALINPANWKL